jgi:hypothetical protein
MGALDIYMQYIEKLNEFKETLPDPNKMHCISKQGLPIPIIPTCFNTASLSNIIGFTKVRNEEIFAEYDSAKRIMEVAITGYNEFILAYPMHKKYEEMLKSLTKYKNALKGINYESMIFPLKFIGTSSYTCS